MLFSRDRLLELTDQDAGELAAVPFPALLLAHALHGRTVELRLRRGHVDKRIFFEGGAPVDCRSNLLHETIGRYLVQQGRLTEDAYQEGLRESVARGKLIGEILIERERIDSAGLFRALQQNLARKLLDVFIWREGRFLVVRDPPPTGSSLKVKVPQLVLTGVSRFAPAELVAHWIEPFSRLRLVPGRDPLSPLADLRLSPPQARLLETIGERPRGLDELVRDSGEDGEETARWISAFALLGAVAAEADPPAGPAASAAAPAPAPVPIPAPPAAPTLTPLVAPASDGAPAPVARSAVRPAAAEARPGTVAPPAPPEDSARLAKAVHEAYLNFRRQDAFDLLGVSEDAPLAFVRYQYLDFARRFAPWRFEAGKLAQLAEQARELFLAGALAYAELEKTESREELRFRRQRSREEAARQKSAGYFQIQTDLLDPETQFAKGLSLREAGRLRPAIQQLEFAVDCDPGNALYLAELAWTRCQESPAVAARAFEDLKQAVRLDPEAGLPLLYAGEVCAALGDRAQAEVLLRRAVKLLAPDRRPLDALRRLAADRRR